MSSSIDRHVVCLFENITDGQLDDQFGQELVMSQAPRDESSSGQASKSKSLTIANGHSGGMNNILVDF